MGRQSLKDAAARKGTAVKIKSQTASVMKQRTAAIGQMSAKLKEKFNEVEEAVNNKQADNIRYYWSLGKLLVDVEQHPEEYVGRGGESGLELIHSALSTQSRTLRLCAQAAREFTESQLESIVGLYNRDTNWQLNWGHLPVLMTLPTHGEREAWAEKAITEMYDPNSLRAAMAKASAGNRGHSHGRNHKVPGTLAARIRQVLSVSNAWLQKQQKVWHGAKMSLWGDLNATSREALTDDMLKDVKDARTVMEEMKNEIENNIEAMAKTIEYMERQIELNTEERVGDRRKTGQRRRQLNVG